MAQQWPTTAPSVSPGTHDPVATQAYQAGGGDYFATGLYSHGLFTSGSSTTVALDLNVVYARPFVVPVRRSFDRIGVNVTVAATAGGVLRMGIYDSGPQQPGSLRVDAGTIASTSTGAKEITITQTLDPGVYWVAVVAQVAACTVTAYPNGTTAPWAHRSTPPYSGDGKLGAVTTATVSGALGSWVSNGTSQLAAMTSLRAS